MGLIVFTNNGQTIVFHKVDNFEPNTKGFNFTYTGNNGVKRTAYFNQISTAGFAVYKENK